jgi:uncharacterized protein YpmS
MTAVRKRLRIVVLVAAVGLLLIAAGVLALYVASQQVPDFYQRAMQADPAAQKAASDKMLQQTTAFVSDVKKEGRWQALFTEEQINGWLAVDLVKNHRDVLAASISDPRVQIEPDRMSLACRYQEGRMQSVLSLTVGVSLAESNAVALRIRKARAGAMPLPLDSVLSRVSEAARHAGQKIQWRQVDGDPVALISLDSAQQGRTAVEIDTIVLRKGEIYVAGTTKRR